MIAVLAVLAILAAALVPLFIRQMDKVAGDQESAVLKSFGHALQQSIMRHRYIPGDADWASRVATELGVDAASVTNSPRNQPRFFLIDQNLSIGGGGLPYTQTSDGATGVTNARVMLVSSIGRALPASIVSGVTSSNDFNAIWNWNDAGGALPGSSFAWTSWPNSDDLRVERVDLSPLFVLLQLTCGLSSRCCPHYSIDTNNWVDVSNGWTNAPLDLPGYFIQNSILYLYNDPAHPTPDGGYLDSQQILIRNNSFTYDQNTWRGSIGGEAFLAGLDIASVVNRYLAAYPNVRAQNGTNQQMVVVQSMMTFMDRYDDWANAGFPTNSGAASYVAVVNAQAAMKAAVQDQYLKGPGQNPKEVPCP
jgi:type II secretory pathway pseudopilin PulG